MSKLAVLVSIFAVGCGAEEPFAGPDPSPDDVDRAAAAGTTQLYSTCGDPVCSGWTAKGLPRCHHREAGDACDPQFLGKECDPHDACNTTLVCSDVDPVGPYGCPI